jgi:hypothetical protein
MIMIDKLTVRWDHERVSILLLASLEYGQAPPADEPTLDGSTLQFAYLRLKIALGEYLGRVHHGRSAPDYQSRDLPCLVCLKRIKRNPRNHATHPLRNGFSRLPIAHANRLLGLLLLAPPQKTLRRRAVIRTFATRQRSNVPRRREKEDEKDTIAEDAAPRKRSAPSGTPFRLATSRT